MEKNNSLLGLSRFPKATIQFDFQAKGHNFISFSI